MLYLLTYYIVLADYAWGICGLLACSFLSTPLLSLGSTLALTLMFPIFIVVGSMVGSPLGFGEIEVNSGYFSLLLIVTYWWLVYLLPCVGQQALSLILAPPRSTNNAYLPGHTIHKFPRHHRKFGVFVTYSTQVIVLAYITGLLNVAPPHPIDGMILNNKNPVVDLQQNISHYLLPETINWDKGVLAISSGMSFALPIVVHASLLTIILAWNAHIL
jgi:hypothetical protein